MKVALTIATSMIFMYSVAIGVSQVASHRAGKPSKEDALGSATLQQPCTTSDDLLKYQQFLRRESDAQHRDLDLFIYLMTSLATVAGALFVFAGFRTRSEIRSRAKIELETIESEAKQKIEKVYSDMQRISRTRFDERFAELEETYERRQAKYFKLLRSYLSMMFVANPDLCSHWVGEDFNNHHFKGKRILWVDDDRVGIAMFVELLCNCGIDNEICGSTSEVMSQSFTRFNLIVSNLRREPEDNAGLLMTQKIRKDMQSKIPIIIFTRPEHKAEYEEELTKAGVNFVATSDRELFPSIARLLSKDSSKGEE